MSDIKQSLYDKIIEVLNLNSQGLIFEGGYSIGIYRGIPYRINKSEPTTVFSYARQEVIPVSEEYNQETASVNLSDRSDYIAQYQVECRLKDFSKVQTALSEMRYYFFVNKQHIISETIGTTTREYTMSFKVNRGDKQSDLRDEGGNYYARYKINAYFTAVQDGGIFNPTTEKWRMRLNTETIINATSIDEGKWYEIKTVGTTDYTDLGAADNNIGTTFKATRDGVIGDGTGTVRNGYEDLVLIQDETGTSSNIAFSTATGKSKGLLTNTSLASQLRVSYTGSEMTEKIYEFIQNKLTMNTLFDIQHIYDGNTFDYVATISGGGRSNTANGIKILTFNWIEADI